MGWMMRDSNAGIGNIFISFPTCPDRLWGPPRPYSTRSVGFFFGGKRAEA